MLLLAYGCDRHNEKKRSIEQSKEDAEQTKKEKQKQIAKSYLRRLASQFGQNYVIECVTNGTSSAKATPEEKDEIKKNFRLVLETESLEGVDIN